MTSSEPIRIELWRPSPPNVDQDIEMLGGVLCACVHGGASVSFILPFSHENANSFWRDRVLPAVQAGLCCVLIARAGARIVGTVQLDLATPPNQPHRAEVRKLLVHPNVRRRGTARASCFESRIKRARPAGRC